MHRHLGRLLLGKIHFNAPCLFGLPTVFTGNTKLRSEETGFRPRYGG
jgi:hypothetical protein